MERIGLVGCFSFEQIIYSQPFINFNLGSFTSEKMVTDVRTEGL